MKTKKKSKTQKAIDTFNTIVKTTKNIVTVMGWFVSIITSMTTVKKLVGLFLVISHIIRIMWPLFVFVVGW